MKNEKESNLEIGIKSAKQIAAIFTISYPTKYDDFLSDGYLAVTKALNTYDDTKNIKFVTYIAKCIQNEILYQLRKEKKHNNVVSLFETRTSTDKGDDLLYIETIPIDSDVEDEVTNNNLFELIQINIDNIFHTERQKEMFRLKMSGKYLTYKEIANVMGISTSYASKINHSVDKRLMVFIKKQGYKL